MSDHDRIETTSPSATEPEDSKSRHSPSPSQVAAVVEAAYILEALRK